MLSPSDVTAILITKGDVDMAPVLDSLIFPTVVVWDNSSGWFLVRHPGRKWAGGSVVNAMTYSRVLAAAFSDGNQVIYSQDDDIVHTREAQERIISEYEPGVLTGCMWPEWSDGAKEQGIENGYDDLVFMGSGSVYDRKLPARATNHYLKHFPDDDFFRLWSDTIVGVLAPTKQLDIRFDALPCAEDDNRMCNLPDAVALKTEAIRRARAVRDMVLA